MRTHPRRQRPRLALIGCGAVVEHYYLPALNSMGWEPRVLVDRDTARVGELARVLGCQFSADYATALDEFDAAVVAVPNSFHASVAGDLLSRGKHVLVEKPMATTSVDCADMIQRADGSGAVLAVGLWRRFLKGTQQVKALIDSGRLGAIESFEFRDGFVYNWPLASDAQWRKEVAGGGVLFDMGPHTLDLLTWWLGPAAIVTYQDDNLGGVEADSLIEVEIEHGIRGVVELSRTRNIGSAALIRGTNGAVEISLWDGTARSSPKDLLAVDQGRISPRDVIVGTFQAQLTDWSDSIKTGREPFVSGAEGALSIALVEACYSQRQPWELPWLRPSVRVNQPGEESLS